MLIEYTTFVVPPESREEYRKVKVPRTIPLTERSDSCTKREVEKASPVRKSQRFKASIVRSPVDTVKHTSHEL